MAQVGGKGPYLWQGDCFPFRGQGSDVSIKELAETIKEKVGFKGEFVYNTSKPDGTMQKLTDVNKLHELGWKHKVDINQGIEKMYQWYLS